MKVKFLQDYRGVLTQERYFTAGTVVEVDEATGQALINAKRAEAVKPKKGKDE